MNVLSLFNILRAVVNHLVNKEYEEIYRKDIKKINSPETIKENIEEYPGILTMPRLEDLLNFDIYFINDDEVKVEFTLWYDNEESDLSIILNIYYFQGGKYEYCLYGILVK